VVNIPAAGRSEYGKEIRSLFLPDNPDHLFLGSDASGLEARMLCHYMDDMEYTDLLLNGDIHTFNQELAGLKTRDDAKTFLYALLYGAGDANLGSQVGGSKADGARMRARFMDGLPKYATLLNRVKEEAETGYLTGLDGRPIRMRRGKDGQVQSHKALNTLLQSAGAIVMKYGMIFLNHWVKEANLDAHQVLWMHDEVQWSCHKDDLEQLTHFANNYVRVAGEYLQMNIPLASEAMVGRSWYETH
jgi:DNA polymerase I-like protein with 3'-5' exonuclease and polymerase domains